MDEDMRIFITEWLKDGQNDVWNKSLSSNSDMIEAIFSLIEEWKSNKEVKKNKNFLVDSMVLPIFKNLITAIQHFMYTSLWVLPGKQYGIESVFITVCSKSHLFLFEHHCTRRKKSGYW